MNKTVKITMLLVATLMAAQFSPVESRRRRHGGHRGGHHRRHRGHHYRSYGYFGYPYRGFYGYPFGGISLSLGGRYRTASRWQDYGRDLERLYKNDKALERAFKQQQDALERFAKDSKNLVKDMKKLIEENKDMRDDIEELKQEIKRGQAGRAPAALRR